MGGWGFHLVLRHRIAKKLSNKSTCWQSTIHDHKTSDIAWFTHRTKKGPGHNWEGISGGPESDMFDEVMGKVKDAGFNITEIITDKPTLPITYCSNHCAKTLHKDLKKIEEKLW